MLLAGSGDARSAVASRLYRGSDIGCSSVPFIVVVVTDAAEDDEFMYSEPVARRRPALCDLNLE